MSARTVLVAFLLILAGACGKPDKPGVSLYLALQRGDIEQVERHIHWGTDFARPLTGGLYPLHMAAQNGRIIIVRRLLKHGVEVDVRDSSGHTPLDLAILGGRTQVAEELLKRGATLDASALLLSAARQDTADRDIVRFLLERGADIETRSDDGDTPLLVAIRHGNHRLVTHLLIQGADVNAQAADGTTALALARSLGRTDIASLLQRQGAREQ